ATGDERAGRNPARREARRARARRGSTGRGREAARASPTSSCGRRNRSAVVCSSCANANENSAMHEWQSIAAGFEPVAAAFEGGFFAASVDGELVIDLGERDDLGLIFSGTKGLVAICLLVLIEQGRLRLDDPVAAYWPGLSSPDVLVRLVVSPT